MFCICRDYFYNFIHNMSCRRQTVCDSRWTLLVPNSWNNVFWFPKSLSDVKPISIFILSANFWDYLDFSFTIIRGFSFWVASKLDTQWYLERRPRPSPLLQTAPAWLDDAGGRKKYHFDVKAHLPKKKEMYCIEIARVCTLHLLFGTILDKSSPLGRVWVQVVLS